MQTLLTTLILLLAATSTTMQEPQNQNAQKRMLGQMDLAAQEKGDHATKRAWFQVVAYPADQAEYQAMRGEGILLISVFADTEEGQIKKATLVNGSKRTILPKVRSFQSTMPEGSNVHQVFGGSRLDHFFSFPLTSSITNAQLEITFEKEGSETRPLAQSSRPAYRLSDGVPTERIEPGENLRALHALLQREYPAWTFEKRVRVSQSEMHPNALRLTSPKYPLEAKANRVSGSVVMVAIIGKDGLVKSIRIISGHQVLVPAAFEALRQWQYRPYIVDGEPVEVETSITINFSISPF